MMNCRKINEIRRSGKDLQGLVEKFRAGFHILICGNCQRYENGLKKIQSYMSRLTEKRAMKDKLFERQIVEEITRKIN